jgi:hypothetical protein
MRSTIPLLGLALAACSSTQEARRGDHPTRLGLGIRLTEHAEDGTFGVLPRQSDRAARVDVNSLLRLQFDPPVDGQSDSDKQLELLAEAIGSLASLADRHVQLFERHMQLVQAAAAAPGIRPQADPVFIEATQAFQQDVSRVLVTLVPTLMTRAELNRHAIDSLQPGYGFYRALAEPLDASLDDLRSRIDTYQAALGEFEVMVRATHLPASGGRQALHVENYDDLDQGDFTPFPASGLLPTSTEAARLRRDLAKAGTVVDSLRELRRKRGEVEGIFAGAADALLEEARRLGADIGEALGDLPSDWRAQVQTGELPSLGFLVQQATLLESFRDQADGAATIEDVVSALKLLADLKLGSWGENLAGAKVELATQLTEDVQGVALEGADRTRVLVLRSVDGLRERLAEALPNTFGMLAVFTDMNRLYGATAALDRDLTLPRTLEELLPAELDLRYGGVLPGDTVQVRVDFTPTQGEGSPPAPIIYDIGLRRAGWHRQYSADVLYLKSVSGALSDRYQSNVGLSLEWHDYRRDEPNGWWNRLDPGFGFHAAFLDQDSTESVELGAGINASILGGLIRVGYGYNLSGSQDQEYTFIGFGLLSMLGQIQDFGSELTSKGR